MIPTDEYLAELQEAVSRRHAERTYDWKLPAESLPDFRPRNGAELETYGFLVERSMLPDDPYQAAEWIVETMIGLEEELIAAVTRPRARVYLCGRGPQVFRKVRQGTADEQTPELREQLRAEGFTDADFADVEEMRAEERQIKVRLDFAVRGPLADPPELPKTEYGPIGFGDEYPNIVPAR